MFSMLDRVEVRRRDESSAPRLVPLRPAVAALRSRVHRAAPLVDGAVGHDRARRRRRRRRHGRTTARSRCERVLTRIVMARRSTPATASEVEYLFRAGHGRHAAARGALADGVEDPAERHAVRCAGRSRRTSRRAIAGRAVRRRQTILSAVNLALGLAASGGCLRQFGRGCARRALAPARRSAHSSRSSWRCSPRSCSRRFAGASVLGAFPNAPSLGRLFAFRAASQSLAVDPAGRRRVGGEPLRVWYAMQAGVLTPIAVTSVVVDRTLGDGDRPAFRRRVRARARDARRAGHRAGRRRRASSAWRAWASPTARHPPPAARRASSRLFVRVAPASRGPGSRSTPDVVAQAEDAARADCSTSRAASRSRLAIGVAADLLTPRAVRVPARGVRAAARTDRDRRGRVRVGRARACSPVPGAVGTVEAARGLDLRRPRPPAGGGPRGRPSRRGSATWCGRRPASPTSSCGALRPPTGRRRAAGARETRTPPS